MGYFNKPTIIVAFPSDERNADWLKLSETERLGSVPPGFFARVKPKLSFGDTRERNRRLLKVSSKGVANVEAAVTDWDVAEFHAVTLERVIKAWNLTRDRDGEEIPVEVNPKTIGELDDDDAQAVLSVVLKRDAEAAEEKDPKATIDDSATTTSISTDEQVA